MGVRVHPHLLRHTAASLALATGADMEAVRAMLGHKSLATTQRYVRAASALDRSPAYALAAALG
ncbi:tyrosine-type recombinase/integrase [Brachybacterium sp. DNPG3]